MKKLYTRIAAFALSLVVALGSVCYNPPKAEAVVVESAAAMAGAFTYLSATGFEFAGDGTAYGAMADAFQMMFTDLTEEYDAYVNEVSGYPDVVAPTLQETILGGMTLLENGAVKFSAAAANALGRFEDWLIDRLGLIAEDGTPVTAPVAVVPGIGDCAYYNGVLLPNIDQFITETRPYVIMSLIGRAVTLYFSQEPVPQYLNSLGLYIGYSDSPVPQYLRLSYDLDLGEFTGEEYRTKLFNFPASNYLWSNFDVYDSDGTLVKKAVNPVVAEDWENPVLSVSLPADYEAAPTVDEQYSMVIDTGLTLEDEQSFIDAVLNGVVAGTLAPAYTIESTTAGDVINPDVGTDTEEQANILSWLKYIVQDVRALPQAISDKFAAFPQAIAEAIRGIFVPDTALMSEITDTFSSKFGFISDLHRLGVDLLNLNTDQTPPVIYIHLDDASSNYGYTYGGITKALDMAWYEPYKEDADRIMSGFLWLGFLWLCFTRASDIINGAGMIHVAGQPRMDPPEIPTAVPRLNASPHAESKPKYSKWGKRRR